MRPLDLTSAVVSVTDYSALSRNEVAEFLTTLNDKKVYATTIAAHARLFGFEKMDAIKLEQVALFYILYACKQLIDGGRLSHDQVIKRLGLDKDDYDSKTLAPFWKMIGEYGGLSSVAFNRLLTEFYIDCQRKRFST